MLDPCPTPDAVDEVELDPPSLGVDAYGPDGEPLVLPPLSPHPSEHTEASDDEVLSKAPADSEAGSMHADLF